MVNFKLKTGDTVLVISGKDRGKREKILKIDKSRERVIVEKVNVVKRHQRQGAQSEGGILEKEAPIHISNVQYYCGKCDSAVKLQKKILDDHKKARACGKCGELLDK